MMRTLAFVMAAVAAGEAHALEAQPVLAQDKGQFSLLAIPKPQDGWWISTEGRRVRVYLPNSDRFALGELTDAHRSRRILSAQYLGDGPTRFLELTLNCDCRTRATIGVSGDLILQVADPAEAPKPAGGAVDDTDDADIDRIRKRMMQLLAEASEKGFVQFRSTGEHDGMDARSSAKPGAPAPSAALSCDALERLAAGEDPIDYEQVEALRHELLSSPPEEIDAVGTRLAEFYLRADFFTEARAIAKPRAAREPRMAAAAALAALGSSAIGTPVPGFENAEQCGALGRALKQAAYASVEAPTPPNIGNEEIEALAGLGAGLRRTAVERLALAAIDSGDHATARKLRGLIDSIENGSREQPTLAVIDASLDPENADMKTIKELAQRPDPLRGHALATAAQASSLSDYDGLMDDLEELSAGDSAAAARAQTQGAGIAAAKGDIESAIILYARASQGADSKVTTTAQSAAATLIREELASDGARRFAAIDVFLRHGAFIDDAALASEIATILTQFGAHEALKQLAEIAPPAGLNEHTEVSATPGATQTGKDASLPFLQVPVPAVDLRDTSEAARFSDGVRDEITLIRERLHNE